MKKTYNQFAKVVPSSTFVDVISMKGASFIWESELNCCCFTQLRDKCEDETTNHAHLFDEDINEKSQINDFIEVILSCD